MFLYKEAIKKFRIPQYGFEDRIKSGDNSLWRISAPELVNNSYIVYEITGQDKLGPFEGERRYNHFHALRNCLS